MPETLVLNPSSFMLRDGDFGVAYEGFSMGDINNGSVIEVRDAVLEGEAEAAAAEARSLQADLQIGPPSYFIVNAVKARGGSEFSGTASNADSMDGEGGVGRLITHILVLLFAPLKRLF